MLTLLKQHTDVTGLGVPDIPQGWLMFWIEILYLFIATKINWLKFMKFLKI